MKIIANIPNEWIKESIKEYGVRKVKRALENNISEAMGEWDMKACIEEDIKNQEEAYKYLKTLRKKK